MVGLGSTFTVRLPLERSTAVADPAAQALRAALPLPGLRLLAAENNHTPIIALTANAMSHHAEEYLACGMDEVVAKPLNIAELIHAIERVRHKAGDTPQVAPARRSAEARAKGRL